MTWSIGQLGKAFGLSRSTLLYYDRLGLLCPDMRNHNNYRVYSQQQYERLQKIVAWRETGLSLDAIHQLLDDGGSNRITEALEQQLEHLNQDLQRLRKQQRVTLTLLGAGRSSPNSRSMDKAQWTALLQASGMSDEDMREWHRNFEALMPAAHQDFLESLGISAAEIKTIRRRSGQDPG